jgi:DNA invertase Pin-like site-specific DNA recombinase
MGQADEARQLLDDGEEFIGYFYDVESGMLELEARGLGSDAEYDALGIAFPRAGGLPELLDLAERGGVTRVACERINRVARDTLVSLTVEAHLKKLGVPVLCADEPQGGTETGRLKVRRGGQMNAEIARAELIEMSKRGQRRHAADGYQHGPPPWGYIAVVDPDAPRQANRFGVGRPKTRLALHPDSGRQRSVAKAFELRVSERWKNSEIRRFFASDLKKYPIDSVWTDRRVESILANPKYTGYQVWNRRSDSVYHGASNPMKDWVWSDKQAHPAIVSLETWAKAQHVLAEMRAQKLSGLDRVRDAAHAVGLTMAVARSNTSHVVYKIGSREYVVPRGDLSDVIVEAITTDLGGAAES